MKQLKQERNSELLTMLAKRTERRHLLSMSQRSEVERELWQSFLLLYSTKLFLQKVRFPLNHYININGIKIFHSGDSDENGIAEFEHFRLDKEKIDIAFLGRGFILESNRKGIELVKNYITANHVVLMHLHHDEYDVYKEVATQLKDEFASIKMFRNEMETKNFVCEY